MWAPIPLVAPVIRTMGTVEGMESLSGDHTGDPAGNRSDIRDFLTRASVAMLRAEAGRAPHDRALRELVGELSTLSLDFRTMWASHDVRIRLEGGKRLDHPEAGRLEMTFRSLNLPLPQRAVHELVIYTAEPGTPSEDRLKLLAGWTAPQTSPTRSVRSGG